MGVTDIPAEAKTLSQNPENGTESFPRHAVLNPRPVGVWRAMRPVEGGGGQFATPPRSRERRNVATSGKRRWIALDVNYLKHIFFLKIEVTGQVKLRSKVKLYPSLLCCLLRPN